jgi:uncharacterized protein
MIPDRIVMSFLIVGFLVLLIGFISIALRWMSNDARVRGRSRWIPATLFLGLPLIGGISGILLRARIPIVAGIIFVLPFIGIVVWLIVRPRYLQSANEKPDHAAISLRRRLGWLCASAVIFVVATPFCISFLIVGAARHPGLKADVDPSTHRLNSRKITLRNGKVLTITDPKIDLGYTFEDVEFPAVDGKTLRGWFVPGSEASSVAIIAVHGGADDRRGFLRELSIFHDAGYPVLTFDCRNYGASDGDGKGASFGVNESRDVSSAADYLKRSRGFHQTVAVGWSQGAAATILAAGKDPNIDGVIAVASLGDLNDLIGQAARIYGIPHWLASLTVRMGYWRLNVRTTGTPLEAVAHISPRPILLIHGTEDKTIPFQASQMLFARAGQPKSLWLAPKSGHDVFAVYAQEYKQRVTSFLHTFFPLSKAVPK